MSPKTRSSKRWRPGRIKAFQTIPRAWLRRVAGNAAIDQVRRSARELGHDESWDFTAPEEDVITPSLSDPELDLMVLCCDPELAPQDQLILALKTVSGFTAAETSALLFFKGRYAVPAPRAGQAAASGTDRRELARFPTRFALKQRLPLLLRIIYLMFAWGYLPRRGKTWCAKTFAAKRSGYPKA